jgi:hypothetical protein
VRIHFGLIGCLGRQSCYWLGRVHNLKKPIVSMFGQCAFTLLSLSAWGDSPVIGCEKPVLLLVEIKSKCPVCPVAEFFSWHSVYGTCFNLRSCYLRLTLGRTPLCSIILICVSQHRWLNAENSLTFVCLHNRDREKSSSQSKPTCSIFEQYEPNSSSISGQPEFVAQ